MEHLGHVSCGWSWLERQLNQLIDNINARGVIPSATVAVTETPNGCLLSIPQIGHETPTQPGGGDVAGPYVMRLYDVSWVSATLVDPTTCQTSVVQVLIQDPGGYADFNADIEAPGGALPPNWTGPAGTGVT